MIFITGATGFVGGHLLEALKEKSINVRCLVRDNSKVDLIQSSGCEVIQGDVRDPDSLKGVLTGIETVVHLVGIIEEKGESNFENIHVTGTRNIVDESLRSNVKHIFFQSALGSDINSEFMYFKTKALAEKVVLSSGIPYTIFRPSLIVGKGDGFTERIKELVRAGPAVPVPGNGLAKFQPLYIRDWITCFLKILENRMPANRICSFGGPEHLSFNEILGHIMDTLAIKKPIIHIPMKITELALPFMGLFGTIASTFGKKIPVLTGELLSLLSVDNICEIDSIERLFSFTPARFQNALREFL